MSGPDSDQLAEYARLTAASRALAADLKRDPATLARGLDAGYRLRPHLRVIGDSMAGVLTGEYDRLLIITPPQVGKPVYVGSMVLMFDGSRKRIDEITPGEQVITHLGRPRTVLDVHRQGHLPTVRITTNSGRQTVAALDHPFLTPGGWVNAGDLVPGVALATIPKPATEPSTDLTPEAARLLGMFVGDGAVSGLGPGKGFNCNITVFDPGVRAEVAHCCKVLGYTDTDSAAARGRVNISGGARDLLRKHGLAWTTSWTKRVPPAVFASAPHVVAEFIGGYWDCDGVVSSRGLGRDGQRRKDVLVELYSVSRDLLLDVQHLLLRLGIRSNLRLKKGAYQDTEHISYRLQVIARDDVARFQELIRLANNKRAAALAGHTLPRSEFDALYAPDPVVSVEPNGLEECVCLVVEEDHTFTSDDLVVHNSTLVAEWGPFWWFANRPTDDIVIASYGADLAIDRSKGVRKHIVDYGAEYDLFTQPGSEAAHDWELTSGGHLRAVGVQGGLSGFPANLIVVDDPHADRAQAESPRMRKAVHDWWSSTASKRLQPDMGAVICIQTRWHLDDFAGRRLDEEGRLEEGGRWKVVHLPAIADPKFGKDPLGRGPGEPLTHPKIPTKDRARLVSWWQNMRVTSIVRDWHSLGQGDPQPTEGALVSDELLRMIRDPGLSVAANKIAVAVDPSGGGRDTAGVIGGFLGDDQRLWITHDRSGVMASTQWSREACLLAHETNAEVIIYEKNYGGDMIAIVIRSSWDALVKEGRIPADKLPPRLKSVTARQNKLLRAEPIAQQMLLDRVRLRGVHTDLEREWATWQPTDVTSPGRIDASVYLAYGLLPVPATGRGSAEGAQQLAAANLLPWAGR